MGLGFVMEWLWPGPGLPGWLGFGAGGVAILAALGLAGWAVLQFHRIGTHVDVRKPAIALATSGPYRHSRNPIYVAMTLLHLGVGLAAGSLWVVALAAPALLLVQFGVIRREERYLTEKFGPAYRDYKHSVRRWL